VKDKELLVATVLEHSESIMYLKYMVNLYYEQYKSMGYSVYENRHTPCNYRFHHSINEDSRKVKLYIRGNSRAISQMVLVGTFDNILEMEEYKALGLANCLKSIIT
jgi:hypothetical protein